MIITKEHIKSLSYKEIIELVATIRQNILPGYIHTTNYHGDLLPVIESIMEAGLKCDEFLKLPEQRKNAALT